MASSGDKPKVFNSYSRRDSSDVADELLTGLELAGFAPFLDRHDIAPGSPGRSASVVSSGKPVIDVNWDDASNTSFGFL
jgi:hypothetical protein